MWATEFSIAGASQWFLDWLILSFAITWTVTGVALGLVLVGWLTLPRRHVPVAKGGTDLRASTTARVFDGAILAAVATIVAAKPLSLLQSSQHTRARRRTPTRLSSFCRTEDRHRIQLGLLALMRQRFTRWRDRG